MSTYTIKMGGPGMIVFKEKQIRLPATLHKVNKKSIKFLEAMARANSVTFEIVEAESERLASVVKKMQADDDIELDEISIDETETSIEDLFDGDDTLGDMLQKLDEKE